MVSSSRSLLGRASLRAARVTISTLAVIAGGAALISMLDLGGTKSSHDADDDRPKAAPARVEATLVRLDLSGQEKGGIETAYPTPVPYQDTARVYGTVLAMDRLTSLYNLSLTTSAALRTAEVKLDAARVANARAQNLLKVFPTGKAQAETSEAAYALEAAGVQTAQAETQALRNTAIQDWGPALGQAIVARAPLAENLVLRKTCLVQISPRSGTIARPPERITLRVDGAPVVGDYVSEATSADPRIQANGYFYTVPATPGLLPGTSVFADLPRGEATAGLDIPPSAVVWQAGRAWVYLKAGANTFARQAIATDAAPTVDGGYVVPAESLPRDQRLVVAGAQTLLSEESRAQIPTDEDDQ